MIEILQKKKEAPQNSGATKPNKSIYKNNSNIPKVKTRFHNINQTFEKYTPEELENVLLESQKGKFTVDQNFKKTKFHNFEETFTNYTPQELDEIIEKSQKEKFGSKFG